ncbi:MAG: FAD-dependent oxidoreductase [Rhizobiaceae bacterium]
MARVLTPDICVIGNTEAGFAVAASAVALGASAVMVEHGRPSGRAVVQAFLAAGRRAHAMRSAAELGIGPNAPEVEFRTLARHVRGVASVQATARSAERLTAMGVPVVKEPVRFADRNTLAAGDVQIRPRRFVLAVAAVPAPLPAEGFSEADVLTEETVAKLDRLPAHLVVLGAGARGLEVAQAFRRLGSTVTVLDAATPLPGEDPELAALLLRALRSEGVTIHEGARLVRFGRQGKVAIRVEFEHQGRYGTAEASHVFDARARIADLAALDLAKAGVAFGPGGVAVSPALRSRNRRVHAIGEAIDPQAPPALGLQQAGAVTQALLLRRKPVPVLSPRVVMTEPALASIGVTEAQAPRAGLQILRSPYALNERARAEARTAGHLKVLADAKGGILGVSILGVEAGEAMAVWSLAMQKGLTLAEMGAALPAHSGYAEIGKDAAIAYLAGVARRPAVRWLVRLFRMLG